jgi:hypothetical protein
MEINGSSFNDVDSILKKDRDVVLAAVKNYGPALKYAPELQGDKEVVLAACSNPWANDGLRYASPELQADKEVVMTAIKNVPSSLEYASRELQADKELIEIAQNSKSYRMGGSRIKRTRRRKSYKRKRK